METSIMARRPLLAAVSINGVVISMEAIAAEAQNHPAAKPGWAYRAAARALAIRELLTQEAERLNIQAEPREIEPGKRETPEEARHRALLEREITIPVADEASCRRFYENNLQRFRSPDLFEPTHILFSASPQDDTAYVKAVESAERCIAVLQAAPDAFARLAKEESACSSAQDGGRLGQILLGDTVPEFEKAMTALAEGQLCATPVKSRFGVHVLRLDRKIEGRTLPFEAVRMRIADYLTEASWRRGAAQYVRVLAGGAEVIGVDLDGADTALVQ